MFPTNTSHSQVQSLFGTSSHAAPPAPSQPASYSNGYTPYAAAPPSAPAPAAYNYSTPPAAAPSRPKIPKRGTGNRNDRRRLQIGHVTLLSQLQDFLEKNKPPSIHERLGHLSRKSSVFFGFANVFERHKKFHLRVCRLKLLNKEEGHPFFKSTTLRFLTQLTPPKQHSNGRSEFWCQPPGILKSLQLPTFAFFATFHSGFQYYSPKAENVFLLNKISRSVLVNPPFSTRGETEKDPIRFRSIFHHISHWINVAYNSEKPMALILPNLSNFKFYPTLAKRRDVAIMHFKNPVIFARGSDFELNNVSPETISILLIGIHFSPTEIENNCMGNFVMRKKLLSEAQAIFTKFYFHDFSVLKDFLSDSVEWMSRVHALIKSKSPTFVFPEEIPSRQPFSLGKKTRNISNFENFRTRTVDVLDSRFFYKLENARKKVVFTVSLSEFIQMSKNKMVFVKKKRRYCTFCRKETHDTENCFLNPLSKRFLVSKDDQKLFDYLHEKRVWTAHYLPSFLQTPAVDVLFRVLRKVDQQAEIFKAEILQLGCVFSTNSTFSMLRNHIHFLLAVNSPITDIMNFALGFNPLLSFKDHDPPRIHVTYPKPRPEVNALIWKQVFQDLKENKIFWIDKKDLLFCVPIFVIHQLNAFGQHKDRLINNFAPFSHLIRGVPFKLRNMEHLAKFSRGAYVLVLDIKSCYPTLQLLFANFFGFKVWSESDSCWEYFSTKSPLFGVHYAPYMAYLALKFLITFLAKFGFFSSVYIDDIYIIIARAEENISEEVFFMRMKFIIGIFVRVGIKLSAKMRIESTTFPLYTGVFFSTILERTFPNPVKIQELQTLIFKAIDDNQVSLSLLGSIEGKTKWVTRCRKFMFSRMISHLVSRVFLSVSHKKLSRKEYHLLYGSVVPLSDEIISIFYLFFREINLCYLDPLKFQTQNFATLVTDASPNAAGFFLELPGELFETGAISLNEAWSTFKFSSTFAEFEALYLSLLQTLPRLHELNISELLILTDSNPLFLNMRNLGSKIPRNHDILLRIKSLLDNAKISFELGWHPRSTIYAQTADFYTNNFLVQHLHLTTFLVQHFGLQGKLHIFNSTLEILRFTKKYFYRNNFDFALNDILVFLLPLQFTIIEFYELILMLKALKMSFLIVAPAERIQQKKNFLDTHFFQKYKFKACHFPLEILAYPQAYRKWTQVVFWHFS